MSSIFADQKIVASRYSCKEKQSSMNSVYGPTVTQLGRSRITFALILSCSVLLTNAVIELGTSQDLDPVLHRKLDEGVQEAQELYKKQVVYGDFRFLSYDGKQHDVKIGMLRSDHILRRGPWFRDHTTDSIQVMNPRYVFELTKSPNASRFSLNWIAERKNLTNKQLQQIEYSALQVYGPVLSNYRVFGWFLWDLLDSPRCSIRSIRETTESGINLIEVEYSLMGSAEGFAGKKIGMNGTFACDPNRLWTIVRETVTHGPGGRVANVSEFESTNIRDDQLPILTRLKGTGFKEDGTKRSTNVLYEFISEDDTPLTEDMFYLSHYGLPEPNFKNSWVSSWMVYLFAGVTLILAGRHLIKRRTAHA